MKTPRILVVDDDLGVIGSYRFVLEESSLKEARRQARAQQIEVELFGAASVDANPYWRVVFSDQGADAVEKVRQAVEECDPFAAIFIDVRMPPGIDGHESVKLIRKIDPDVNIVVVSAYSDYTFDEFLRVAGPENKLVLLNKPVWPEELKLIARSATGQAIDPKCLH